MAARRRARRRGWGTIRQRSSGRWQAYYVGPDLAKHYAPSTFDARADGEAWLAAERHLVQTGQWEPPSTRGARGTVLDLSTYASGWLEERKLKPRTREHYGSLLREYVLPTLGAVALEDITAARVRAWYAVTATGKPTTRTHAYGLLRTILGTAQADGLIDANPCTIRGAGTAQRARKIQPATVAELQTIAENLPERYRSLLMVTAWCALRFGEATELRCKDVDLDGGVLRVRRAVARAGGQVIVGSPKSSAGVRDVAIPPHLLPMLREVVAPLSGDPDALLWPAADGSGHLAPATLYRVFYPAREAAGRPDLRWHDLRHTGAVLAAQTGATLAELMGRLGHSTPQAAMVYQHAARGRDAQIAAALSRIAEPGAEEGDGG